MKKGVMLLFFVFLTASLIMAVKPVSAATPVSNSWTSRAPMHVARSGLGVAEVNGKIYAIGGNAENGVVGTNEEYDPATDTWTYKKPMSTPSAGFATAVYQNKIYCMAEGINEVYDPATDTWETKTPMPTPRTGLQASVANGKIYLIGGYIPAFYTTQNFTATPINEAYDPATDSWSMKAPIPVAVEGYASAVVDNKIYVIGGVSYPEYNFNQIYDPTTDTWSQGTPSPKNTAFGPAGATTGINAAKRIYVLSQDYNFDDPPCVNTVYDPATDTWTSGASVPTERSGFGVAVVNDLFYVIGGFTETFDMFWNSDITLYATNEQYTPFGYGTISPEVSVVSPENRSYTSSSVSLIFTVDKPASWMGYSLDGQDNVTVTGNTTIAGLSNGLHNVTVYAEDSFGNMGAAETISFSVEVPFPTALVATASAASVAVVGVGLFVYFKKRRH